MKAKVVSVQLSLLPRSPSRAASGCERPLWEISSSEGFVELQLVAVVGSSSPGVFAASDASRGSACGAATRDYRFVGFLDELDCGARAIGGRGGCRVGANAIRQRRVDGRIRTTQG